MGLVDSLVIYLDYLDDKINFAVKDTDELVEFILYYWPANQVFVYCFDSTKYFDLRVSEWLVWWM